MAKPAKKPFGVLDFAIACLFAGFFCALSLSDLSASQFFKSQTTIEQRMGFADYIRWKSAAPIIGPIILVVACLLPLVIFGLVRDVVGIVTRQASLKRHIIDLCHLILLGTVLATVIGKVQPTEQLLLKAADKSAVHPEAFVQLQDNLSVFYAIVAALNLLMMFIPFLRWSASPAAAPTTAAAAAAAVKRD